MVNHISVIEHCLEMISCFDAPVPSTMSRQDTILEKVLPRGVKLSRAVADHKNDPCHTEFHSCD